MRPNKLEYQTSLAPDIRKKGSSPPSSVVVRALCATVQYRWKNNSVVEEMLDGPIRQVRSSLRRCSFCVYRLTQSLASREGAGLCHRILCEVTVRYSFSGRSLPVALFKCLPVILPVDNGLVAGVVFAKFSFARSSPIGDQP